ARGHAAGVAQPPPRGAAGRVGWPPFPDDHPAPRGAVPAPVALRRASAAAAAEHGAGASMSPSINDALAPGHRGPRATHPGPQAWALHKQGLLAGHVAPGPGYFVPAKERRRLPVKYIQYISSHAILEREVWAA